MPFETFFQVGCMSMSHLKVTSIELVRVITPTFMHGFQNNLAKLISLRSRSVI